MTSKSQDNDLFFSVFGDTAIIIDGIASLPQQLERVIPVSRPHRWRA